MKKLKLLLVVMLSVLVMPFSVFAEDAETTTTEDSNKVNVYIFMGDGCPHCQEAEEWFASINDEYGDKYTLVSYETWYNTTNADLMTEVAETRGEEANGVPYIIIGNKSWSGFDEASMADEMKSEIDSGYETAVEERYDIKNYVDLSKGTVGTSSSSTTTNEKTSSSSTTSDVVVLLLMVAVVVAVIGGILLARKKTN